MTLPDYPRPLASTRTKQPEELDTLSEEIAEAERAAGLTDEPRTMLAPSSSRIPAERMTRPTTPRAHR